MRQPATAYLFNNMLKNYDFVLTLCNLVDAAMFFERVRKIDRSSNVDQEQVRKVSPVCLLLIYKAKPRLTFSQTSPGL